MYTTSAQADSGNEDRKAELQGDAAAGKDGGQQQQEPAPNGRTASASSQSADRLGDPTSGLDAPGDSRQHDWQLDLQAAVTAVQIQSLQEALTPGVAVSDRVAADMADPIPASELVSQAPMPPGPEPGSRTQLTRIEVQNWPAVAAAPPGAPLSAPQVCCCIAEEHL